MKWRPTVKMYLKINRRPNTFSIPNITKETIIVQIRIWCTIFCTSCLRNTIFSESLLFSVGIKQIIKIQFVKSGVRLISNRHGSQQWLKTSVVCPASQMRFVKTYFPHFWSFEKCWLCMHAYKKCVFYPTKS